MSWALLVTAGCLETGFAVLLKLSDGFHKLGYTAGFALCAMASFGLLNIAIREIPVGTAYAVWTGIGAAGTAIVGMVAFDDPASTMRIASLVLIVGGVVGLNLSGASHI